MAEGVRNLEMNKTASFWSQCQAAQTELRRPGAVGLCRRTRRRSIAPAHWTGPGARSADMHQELALCLNNAMRYSATRRQPVMPAVPT